MISRKTVQKYMRHSITKAVCKLQIDFAKNVMASFLPIKMTTSIEIEKEISNGGASYVI